jgi:hypothetical protein
MFEVENWKNRIGPPPAIRYLGIGTRGVISPSPRIYCLKNLVSHIQQLVCDVDQY